MKICVLGLDCAAPEIVFGDERLVNLRRLMDLGVYGRLESVVPPITVPAWMCMSTSQDPGSLGVYGFRNRSDHSYDKLAFANSASIKALAIWDQLAREGKKSIIVGVPPNYPPRRVNGISIGCFLTPDTVKNDFTDPPCAQGEDQRTGRRIPGRCKRIFAPTKKDWLKQEIFNMCGKQWAVVRWLLTEQEWDYFHFVDIGLDRMHHGFWNYFDPRHVQFEPDNPYQDAIPEYYRLLDEQIGSVLELLDDETILLVVSDHGAQRLDGGFAINEWLIREGLLVLNEYPKALTPFEKLNVNWSKTKVWSEGGYYARVFFNMQGREPQGVIPASEYESFQNQMKARLEALPGENGQAMKSLVFKPRGNLSQRAQRGSRLDRPFRRTLLAFHRNRRACEAPRSGKRHRPRRLQPRPIRNVHSDGAELPAQRRVRRRSPAGYCAHTVGPRRIRNSRDHARPFAGFRHGKEGHRWRLR